MDTTSASDLPVDDSSHAKDGLTRRGLVGRAGAVAGGAVVLGAAVPGTAAPAIAAQAKAPARVAPAGANGLPDARALDIAGQRLVDFEVLELAALYRAGMTTSVEVTQAYLDRIAAVNGPFETYGDNGMYNAFVRIDGPGALEMAKAADARIATEIAGGAPAPYLCGIPMGFKDSIGVKGFKAQNGTTAYAGNKAIGEGAAIARLRAQGVVVLGNTICSAFSGSTVGSFAGNAWNIDYVPGGSSQGSGVAPVARLAAACIGEETGGSITFPSACNGASGIKPSLGLNSVDGVMPLTPGVDVIGPIARSGADAAVILNAMLGPDPEADPQTLAPPNPFPLIPFTPRPGSKPLSGTTIGIPKTDWLRAVAGVTNGVDPQSQYNPLHMMVFTRVMGELETLGATIVDVNTPDIEKLAENPYFPPQAATSTGQPTLATVDGTAVTPVNAIAYANRSEINYIEAIKAFAATAPAAQASALLSNYGRTPSGGSTATFDGAILLTSGVPAAARRDAETRRRKLAENYADALDALDIDFLLIMQLPDVIPTRTVGTYTLSRAYYQVPNAISWPMVSLPVGAVESLPVSVQFWGPRFSEPTLVQAMVDYQTRYPEWHKAVPPEPSARTGSQLLTAAQTYKAEYQVRPYEHEDAVITEAAQRAGH